MMTGVCVFFLFQVLAIRFGVRGCCHDGIRFCCSDSAPPLLLESLWVRQQLQTEASELLSFATRRLTETSVESSGGGEAEGTRAGARGPFQGGAGLPAVAGGASEASTAAAAAAAHAAIPLQLLHTAKQVPMLAPRGTAPTTWKSSSSLSCALLFFAATLCAALY
eukprot:GHVT01038922.1.p1 GENE.GHVT01038922.1~~GHVT01038922.1.p1  ORF type:complete len:176 (+),score=36.07 GHVT01038922.1:35-529(+)